MQKRNTNWFDELFNNSIQQNHSISLSTGTDKAQYYASFSLMDDPGWTRASRPTTTMRSHGEELSINTRNIVSQVNSIYQEMGAQLVVGIFGTYAPGDEPAFGFTSVMVVPGNDGQYWGQNIFECQLVGRDEVKMEYANTDKYNGKYFINNLYLKYIFGRFEGTFKITADNEKNPTVLTLTNVDDPTDQIRLSKSEIDDPLNN